jgi:hypothetical protein
MRDGNTLLEALESHGGNDVVIPYSDIARLFPSSNPHPDSFDYNAIDQEQLKCWASENGFEVSTVPDQAPENAKSSPPIRFRRKT